MPRIPIPYAREALPTSPGTPRGGVGLPVPQQPTVNDPGATLLERSLQALPQAVGGVAQVGVQMADLELRQRHAQDVLDGTLADQAFAQSYQAKIAELEAGDYRTLPTSVLSEGRVLAQQVAQERGLSPQARALYQARVEERLTGAQQKALAFYSQRRDQDTLYAQSTAMHEALRAAAEATSPYEAEVAWGRLTSTFDALQATHLVNPQAVADAKAKAYEGMRKNRALVAIRAAPLDAYGELHGISQAQAQGETPVITTEAFRGLSAGLLAELTDDAWQHLREEGTYRTHLQAATEKQQAREQEANARHALADLTSLAPVGDNVGTIQRQMAHINEQARIGALSYGQQQSLLSDAQAWLRAAQRPPAQQDDPQVESLVSLKLLTATTVDDLAAIRRDVIQHAGRLKPETLRTFDGLLRQRESDLTLMQDESIKAGRQMILDAFVPEAAMLGMAGAAAMMQEEERRRLSDALRAYEGEMTPLNRVERQAQGRRLAQNIITEYLERPGQATDIKSLPPFLWAPGSDPIVPTPVTREEAQRLIRAHTRDEVLRGALLRRFDQVTAAMQVPPPAPKPPPPPGLWQRWFGGSASGRRP